MKLLPGIILVILVLILGGTMAYTVDTEEIAVVTRFGRIVREEPPGLHFKFPMGIEQAYKVKTQRVLKEEFGFRTAQAGVRTQYSGRGYLEESLMLTGDLNVAVVEWIVQYRVDDPKAYLFRLRDPERTLRDVSEAMMRLVVGDHSVDEVLTIGREEIERDVQERLDERLRHYGAGIRIVTVKLQNVTPPEEVRPSFDEVNKAKQDMERMVNEAWQAYNERVPKAEGEKEKAVSEAMGYESERLNLAKGDANRFNAILAEYRKAPEVTRTRMYLEAMGDIYGKAKDKYIIDENARSILPLLQLGTDKSGEKK
ncbi:FtsH protease activity modulator HflK [bacterium]|nr:FtsH protease activity modulator HflK [bacterium]